MTAEAGRELRDRRCRLGRRTRRRRYLRMQPELNTNRSTAQKLRHSLEQCLEVSRCAAAATRAHRATNQRRRRCAVHIEREALANRGTPAIHKFLSFSTQRRLTSASPVESRHPSRYLPQCTCRSLPYASMRSSHSYPAREHFDLRREHNYTNVP